MKIGILTLFWGNNNWGGTLQGYALKKYIETRYPETKVDIIRYRSSSNVVYRNRFEQMMQYGMGDIIKKVFERLTDKMKPERQILDCRKGLFRDFHECYTENTHTYNDDDYVRLSDDYDCLICGSDQIWNPNVAYPAFFLKEVKGCKKISYAASIARDHLSIKEKKSMVPLIKEFDHISVREKTAKSILEQELPERDIYQVLDPVLMLTRQDWEAFLPEKENKDPYAVSFFFSDSLKCRKKLISYCERNNWKLVMLPHCARYQANDEVGTGEKMYDIGPREFVRLIEGASCVFTDSFHGAVFSIIFEKPFLAFCRDKVSKVSKNSRMTDLLTMLGLGDRLTNSDTISDEVLNAQIDYSKVEKKLSDLRVQSARYLDKALSEKKPETIKSVDGLAKKDCCGCGSCKELCPTQAITMKMDEEGYLYPSVNSSLCIECGNCVRHCPVQNHVMLKPEFAQTWVGHHDSKEVRENSSSGGIFYEIASSVLNRGGVVYGAGFDQKFSVRHERITSVTELARVMKSKYVQSTLEDVWQAIVSDLKDGKKVLFAGTPCQCAAVHGYLESKGIRNNNLLLVDFICHGVPSPGVWDSYLAYVSGKKQVTEVSFRDKKCRGWHDFHMQIRFNDGNELIQSHELNKYMQTFLGDQNIRPSCYQCPFKGNATIADLTLGDAWKIEKEFAELAEDKGTSILVARTNNGREMIASIREYLVLRESDYHRWCNFNPSLIYPTRKPDNREEFFAKYIALSMSEFWQDVGRVSAKKRLRYFAKRCLKTFGLEKLARKLKR